MASRELDVRYTNARDTAQNWSTNNPVLLNGELGLETDTRKFKFGDGVHAWNELEYASATAAVEGVAAPTVNDTDYDIGTVWVADSKAYVLVKVDGSTATWKRIVTPDELANLGAGDMLKSQYATNSKAESGYVDAAIMADKLTSGKTIAISGDVESTGVSFDGSANITLTAALKNIVTAGTYAKVTVNAKGLVTGYEALSASDVGGLGSAATKEAGTAAGNVLLIGADGKIDESVLPKIAITDVFTAESASSMNALDVQTGDICIRTDENKSYIYSGTAWVELKTPTDAVLSVNGKTGAVTLTTSDIAEGTNLYYTEARATANFNTNIAKTSVSALSDSANVLMSTDTYILNGGTSANK